MTLNDTLGEYGAGGILFKDGPSPIMGLEIWNVEVSVAKIGSHMADSCR